MNKIIFAFLCASLFPASMRAVADDVLKDSSRVYDIEEVYVYDQPKEVFRLRQQSLSSTSFNRSQLKSLNIQGLSQLSSFVPSFTMPEYGSRLTSSMYVRGIGSRINSPAVGIYVDGMPIQSKSAFNFHTYDIDRIDVLRGPQGTLYGMNTEGGLIRIYSKNPFEYSGTDLTLSLGSKFWRKIVVGHSTKLNDKTALSLSTFYDGQNGFFKNQFNGEHADLFNEFGGKGRLLWNPNAKLNLSFIADYQYVRQNGFPYGQIVSDEQIATADITSPYYKLKAGTQAPNQNRQSNYRRNMLNTGVGIKYNGNSFVLNSMLSWQFLKDYMMMDIDYLPQDFMHLEQRQHQNSLTEELTIKNKHNSRWHWTFGAFGSYQWLRTDGPVYFNKGMNDYLSNVITNYAYTGMLNAMAKRIAEGLVNSGMPFDEAMKKALAQVAAMIKAAGGCTIKVNMQTIPGIFRTPRFNLGVYHESNFDITDHLVATLGLRYDYSQVAIDYATSARVLMDENALGVHVTPTITSSLSHHESNHFNQFLPKIGLTYRLNNGSNVYTSWAKGYRAGGYNFQMFSDVLQTEISKASKKQLEDLDIQHDEAYYANIARTIEYKPETSWNYEIGTHLNLFGGQMHLDVATYYMQIRNQQLSVMAGNYGFGRMMTNAGRSHSCGIEASAYGKALEDKFSYTLSYGFTSARFDEYSDSTKAGIVDYKKNKVPFVPQHTLAANADYRLDVDPAALLDPTNKFHLRAVTVGANLSAQGRIYWDNLNTVAQNFYATLGVHADADFGPMHVNLWIRNLTDTKFNTFAVQSSTTGTKYTFAQLGNPLQIGVDLSFHF